MKEALPIQCVEAVFLAVHLTNGIKSVRGWKCVKAIMNFCHLNLQYVIAIFCSYYVYLFVSNPECNRVSTIILYLPSTMVCIGVRLE
jgi:energy-converting hydrogenase Eha subunit C